MKAVVCALVTVAIGLAAMPEYSCAQAHTAIAVDATVGAGYGKGGEFFDRELVGARFAASLRRSSSTRVGLFGEVAIDWLALPGQSDVVYPSSPGTPTDRYPELSGPTAVVGVVAGSTSQFELRIGIGGGVYGARGTRAGAVVSQSDAAFFPISRLGIVAGTRWIVVPRYRGDRLSTLPWMLGLRLR